MKEEDYVDWPTVKITLQQDEGFMIALREAQRQEQAILADHHDRVCEVQCRCECGMV